MVFEKRAARRREPRNLEPVPQSVTIQEHPQHHHLVRLVEVRRLEHPEPRPKPFDDALLALRDDLPPDRLAALDEALAKCTGEEAIAVAQGMILSREDMGFRWEQTDKASALRTAAGIK
jgi:hypothetical protein